MKVDQKHGWKKEEVEGTWKKESRKEEEPAPLGGSMT